MNSANVNHIIATKHYYTAIAHTKDHTISLISKNKTNFYPTFSMNFHFRIHSFSIKFSRYITSSKLECMQSSDVNKFATPL